MSERRQPTRFLILAGLPGTGKTALAEALASRLGGIVLSKDRVRATLFPDAAIDYSETQDDFCMSVIVQAAGMIAANQTVPFIFFDGRTFSRNQQVQQIADAAVTAGAELRILHLYCPDALALERIAAARETHVASNRDAQLYFRVKANFEPIAFPKLDVDTSKRMDECTLRCVEYLQR